MTPLIFNCHLPCPAGRDSPGRHLLFLTGPRDSESDPGRPAQLFGAGLLSLGVPFYCIEITSEKMRGWLRGQRSFRPILAISPTSFQRTTPVYQAVLADAKFHEQLLVFDRDLAASARAARCWLCGGALHSASYDRKPRGCPGGFGHEYAERFSFCCAVDGCRKRTTPPSLRFLGRKVYLATVVTLISAMLLGTTPARLARLSAMPGIDRRALARWRTWWRSTFTDGPFASVAKAALAPPLDIAGLPVSLLDRVAGGIEQKLSALLRFLAPLTGGASACTLSDGRRQSAEDARRRPSARALSVSSFCLEAERGGARRIAGA
jgi:hypothetical protein